MTRINIVPVSELTDQHLVAEYAEILRIGKALQVSLKSKTGIKGIPQRYTLGTGHMKFFYNKGKYLENRYLNIREEMINRGMKPDLSKSFNTLDFPAHYYNDWSPVTTDFIPIRQRLEEKINLKPTWYRYYGKNISK